MLKKSFFVWLLSLLVAHAAFPVCSPAENEESPVEKPAAARKGFLKADVSWDYYSWKNGDRDEIFLLAFPVYGLSNKFDFSVETPYVIRRSKTEGTHERLGDVTFIGRYALLENYPKSETPFLTLKGSVKLDNGNSENGVGTGDVEYSLAPVVWKQISKSLSAEFELGYAVVTRRQDDNLRNYFLGSLALDWAVTEAFDITAEYSVNEHPDRTRHDQKVAKLGLEYELSNRVKMLTSFKKGVTDSSPDWGFGFGFSIRFSGLN